MSDPTRTPTRPSVAIVLLVVSVAFGALFITAPNVAAATVYHRGPITSDEVWGSGDTHVLTGHVTVRLGVRLTIAAGATVRVDPGVALFVDGTLIAGGTPGSRITFAQNNSGALSAPQGIQFNTTGGGSVTWSTFDRFTMPVYAIGGSPTITDNVADSAFIGIRLEGASSFVSSNTIRRGSIGILLIGSDAIVTGNSVNGTGIGIEIVGSGLPWIFGNTITNTTPALGIGPYGIYAVDSSAYIESNTVSGVQGARGASAIAAGNNGAAGGLAAGIFLENTPFGVVLRNAVDRIVGGQGGNGAGNAGGQGGLGGEGGPGVGILLFGGNSPQVTGNTVTNIAGGRGGAGGGGGSTASGGRGGDAGDAAGIYLAGTTTSSPVYTNDVSGVAGGIGGFGGDGLASDGGGGLGGDVFGIFLSGAEAADATGNTVASLRGGLGGNSTSTGTGDGRGAKGGDAIGLAAFPVAGSGLFHSNYITTITGGDGGRGSSGGEGGNATGLLGLGNDDGRFNATVVSSNWVEFVTGGQGGNGGKLGGPGGVATGIASLLVTASSAANTFTSIQGGRGGDAGDGTDGGRGGDAAGFIAYVVPTGTSDADVISTVARGGLGNGAPAQASYARGYFALGNGTVRTELTIENATIGFVDSFDLYMENYTDATTINTPFNAAAVRVEVAATLTVMNYLGVDAFWPDGSSPVAGSSVLVRDNGATVWNVGMPAGQARWLLVTDRVYVNSGIPTDNVTRVEVTYLSYSFQNSPRSVDMATSRLEVFVMIDVDAPTSAASALPTYTNTWTFNVSYTASDGNGGGLNNVTLWYRLDGSGGWTPYATQPAAAQGTFSFTGASDGVYEFATTADDLAGNREPGPNANDTWTTVDTVRPGSRVVGLSTYQTSASFLVSWSPDAGVTDIVSYTIQYNRGAGWRDWLVDTPATSGTFIADPAWGTYQFRSLAKDNAGNVETPPGTNDTWTIVDTERPTSQVAFLSRYQTTLNFTVSWAPVGDSFDIATYRIDVNDNGAGWTTWIASTSSSSATFPGVDGHPYQFRSVATDRAGNVETPPAGNDTWTVVDVTPPDSRVTPLQAYYTSLSFTVFWVPASGTTDISTYTLQVSDNDGAWTSVAGSINTPATSAVYVGMDGHRYAFRTIARDRAGNVEIAPAGNDTWTVVDVTRPFAASGVPRGANVNITPLITITFSEPMDRGSVEQAFSLNPDMNGAFVWSSDSRTVTFIPDRDLDYSTRYVVVVDSSARDLAGNTATSLYTFDFTTLAAPPSTLGIVDMWWVLAAIGAAVGGSLFFVILRRRGATSASARAGPKPAAAAVAPEATIDDVFLLYRDGVLIKHETRRLKPDIDTDILSGMLTAVQQFVKDSFRTEEGELDELTFGQMHILIGRGKFLILATMIQGQGTETFALQIKQAIQDIEDHHWDQLEEWDGDMSIAKVLAPYVKKLIRGEYA